MPAAAFPAQHLERSALAEHGLENVEEHGIEQMEQMSPRLYAERRQHDLRSISLYLLITAAIASVTTFSFVPRRAEGMLKRSDGAPADGAPAVSFALFSSLSVTGG